MTIEIADEVARGLTKKELLLEVAIQLYLQEKISLGKAARLAGIHRIAFQAELDKRNISIHYSPEEFDREMENLNAAFQ